MVTTSATFFGYSGVTLAESFVAKEVLGAFAAQKRDAPIAASSTEMAVSRDVSGSLSGSTVIAGRSAALTRSSGVALGPLLWRWTGGIESLPRPLRAARNAYEDTVRQGLTEELLKNPADPALYAALHRLGTRHIEVVVRQFLEGSFFGRQQEQASAVWVINMLLADPDAKTRALVARLVVDLMLPRIWRFEGIDYKLAIAEYLAAHESHYRNDTSLLRVVYLFLTDSPYRADPLQMSGQRLTDKLTLLGEDLNPVMIHLSRILDSDTYSRPERKKALMVLEMLIERRCREFADWCDVFYDLSPVAKMCFLRTLGRLSKKRFEVLTFEIENGTVRRHVYFAEQLLTTQGAMGDANVWSALFMLRGGKFKDLEALTSEQIREKF